MPLPWTSRTLGGAGEERVVEVLLHRSRASSVVRPMSSSSGRDAGGARCGRGAAGPGPPTRPPAGGGASRAAASGRSGDGDPDGDGAVAPWPSSHDSTTSPAGRDARRDGSPGRAPVDRGRLGTAGAASRQRLSTPRRRLSSTRATRLRPLEPVPLGVERARISATSAVASARARATIAGAGARRWPRPRAPAPGGRGLLLAASMASARSASVVCASRREQVGQPRGVLRAMSLRARDQVGAEAERAAIASA